VKKRHKKPRIYVLPFDWNLSAFLGLVGISICTEVEFQFGLTNQTFLQFHNSFQMSNKQEGGFLIKKSCGFLITRTVSIDDKKSHQFLIMVHKNRFDLPKGHMRDGESEKQTALRELSEETGIKKGDIVIHDDFRFEETYRCKYKRYGGLTDVEKTLVVFLAELKKPDQTMKLTEHGGYKWVDFTPDMKFQKNTIDPLLSQFTKYLADQKKE
jgi:bis(5'-nucleosidyl)-tetraphosphatase